MKKCSWPASIESLHAIQEYVDLSLTNLNVDDMRKIQISLVVEEVVINIINHAYRDTSGGGIDVLIEHRDQQIYIHICDKGVPFNPLETEDENFDVTLEERKIGSMGLSLVRHFVDKLEYQRIRNTNHLSLIINHSGINEDTLH